MARIPDAWTDFVAVHRTAQLERAATRNLQNSPLIRDEAMARYARATEHMMDLLDGMSEQGVLHRIAQALAAQRGA